jgi:hypothetical protein
MVQELAPRAQGLRNKSGFTGQQRSRFSLFPANRPAIKHFQPGAVGGDWLESLSRQETTNE